jgi:hypothetical protein
MGEPISPTPETNTPIPPGTKEDSAQSSVSVQSDVTSGGSPSGPPTSSGASPVTQASTDAAVEDDEEDWDDEDELTSAEEDHPSHRVRRRRRHANLDAAELRLLGRRALCRGIADIAPSMLKTVKLRVLGRYLESTRGLEDDDLTEVIRKHADRLADRARILKGLQAPDPDFSRGQLREIILRVLLEEETYSLDENRVEEKVVEYEKELVRRSKALDLTELRRDDADRWHHYDTYRIVLEAAWSNDDTISPDEARLLAVLRGHLNISLEEHWLINALIKRFPKEKCALHTPDEINEARKELQRDGLLWAYRDENNRNIDVIPSEIAAVIRREAVGLELQRTNYRRLMCHDAILLPDLREVLQRRGMNRYGNKPELIERVIAGGLKPSEMLSELDREKLSGMCATVGLKSSGAKAELVGRLIDFYDDLTFAERVTKDDREVWYANYELLAGRAYAELRAKKVIDRDLDIQTMFEAATAFLFEARLHISCERGQKENRADGRLPLENGQTLLWDCKSAEGPVNLQDHLDGQFDGYLRKEAEGGRQPLAFLVIAPSFTPQSIKLAHQYKARSNWDVALVTAEGLKHLAERWAAGEPEKPFPIRLLNRTDIIDKERAEFLLSLA